MSEQAEVAGQQRSCCWLRLFFKVSRRKQFNAFALIDETPRLGRGASGCERIE
jgi:hypothetical protein